MPPLRHRPWQCCTINTAVQDALKLIAQMDFIVAGVNRLASKAAQAFSAWGAVTRRKPPMIKSIKRYRPERYYMRGPGPKWIEKYGGIDQAGLGNHRSNKGVLVGFFFRFARRWRE